MQLARPRARAARGVASESEGGGNGSEGQKERALARRNSDKGELLQRLRRRQQQRRAGEEGREEVQRGAK